MKEYIYMKVTSDEYEFPIAIADTAEGLARQCNVNVNTIYSYISHYNHGRIKHPTYIRCEYEEGELT